MGKKILKIAGVVIGAILLVVIIYLLYVILSYDRIEDRLPLNPQGDAMEKGAEEGREYTIVTQNCGFGAYSPDFTFFMDGGTESWGKSKEEVVSNIDKAAKKLLSYEPDLVLLQEIDTDSTRSYHVDQREQMINLFPGFEHVFSQNFHSAFLMYPLTQPHGVCNSGILTFSKMDITSALRRSLEISTDLKKLVDLDRCYSVSRIPVDNGKELVLYNVHCSAYGGSDKIRNSQITQLTKDMAEEYEKGNYCVCGGDFNHDFTGDSGVLLGSGSMDQFGWAQPFPVNLLPDGIVQCLDYDDEELIATCRNCDVAYGPDCKVVIVDGFLVSENVKVTSLKNIDAEFAYSDHNPVVMKFILE
ncbi:MAG: endonuclease/exonuclease/phosphatase family protein [Lachnospiraceae bacterium]|nr:endonuclease/exonuclease/phosphatase family protein [Lachnospiraceae bacterium]